MPLPFDEQPYDQGRFVALLQHLLPESYLELVQGGDGAGVIEAMAAVGARVSLAATRLEQGDLALYAAGGSFATASVAFTRPDDSAGAFVVQAGTIVGTSISGRNYALISDISFGPTDLGPINGTVRAIATGWEWNVRGPFTTARGEVVPGLIDTVVELKTSPNYAEPRVVVSQLSDAAGGAAAMLDTLAADKLLTRGRTEDDASLSYRVRALPDTVSRDAVVRLLHALLDPVDLPFDFIETFQHEYQECYDAPSPNVGTPSFQSVAPLNPDFNDTTFAFDDDFRGDSPFRNRWLGMDDYRAAFIVVLREDVTVRDTGIAYDDPGSVEQDFHPAVGHPWRQTSAYDCVSTDPPELVFGGCYDGTDTDRAALYVAVQQQVDKIRAAGVGAFFVGVVPLPSSNLVLDNAGDVLVDDAGNFVIV